MRGGMSQVGPLSWGHDAPPRQALEHRRRLSLGRRSPELVHEGAQVRELSLLPLQLVDEHWNQLLVPHRLDLAGGRVRDQLRIDTGHLLGYQAKVRAPLFVAAVRE